MSFSSQRLSLISQIRFKLLFLVGLSPFIPLCYPLLLYRSRLCWSLGLPFYPPSPLFVFRVRLVIFYRGSSPPLSMRLSYHILRALHLSWFILMKRTEWSSAAFKLLPPNSLTRAPLTARTSPIFKDELLSHISPHRVREIEQLESSIRVTYLRTFYWPLRRLTVSFSLISIITPEMSSVFI